MIKRHVHDPRPRVDNLLSEPGRQLLWIAAMIKHSQLRKGVAYYRDRSSAERVLATVQREHPEAVIRDGYGYAVQYRNSGSYYPDGYGDVAIDLVKNPLSDAQREILLQMAEHGTLRYMRGGFWITDGAPLNERGMPEVFSTTPSVMVLERRGLICPACAPSSIPSIDPRDLTDAGRFAAANG